MVGGLSIGTPAKRPLRFVWLPVFLRCAAAKGSRGGGGKGHIQFFFFEEFVCTHMPKIIFFGVASWHPVSTPRKVLLGDLIFLIEAMTYMVECKTVGFLWPIPTAFPGRSRAP